MSMYNQVVVGKTKAGKEVAYRVPQGESLYEIFFVGGGQLPAELTGSWTDARQIENTIKVYLSKETRPEKVIDGLKAAKKRPNKLKPKDK